MGSFYRPALVLLSAVPALLKADATIRYQIETSVARLADQKSSSAVYMKGNKGATVDDHETTIVDFAKQEVTIMDPKRRKYAMIPATEYGDRMSQRMSSAMSQGAAVEEALKSMKGTCATKESVSTETIQGIQTQERDVTCSMTMPMPAGVQQGTGGAMTGMGMKLVRRTWSATPGERVRVPGLWQLSGFELWQKYFMNPTGGFAKIMPGVMAPLMEAMDKNQVVMLRMTMEMSMNFPSPVAGAAADAPLMKMSQEAVDVSTAPLDDSLFAVPGDCTVEPFADLMNGIQAATVQAMKTPAAKTVKSSPDPAIPPAVKAYVPSLTPLSDTQPVLPDEARASHVQGNVQVLVTVGPRGSVEHVEALSGPEALRKAAIDTVRQWTYRPVIRNRAPVTAYTDANVFFFDRSNPTPPGFEITPDVTAAANRLAQLEEAFPRTPEQEFADSEQDAGGGGGLRRFYKLNGLAVKAAELGFNEKAKAYADESLAAAAQHPKDWNYGNAIHDGHMVLGLLALRNNDVPTAREELIKAGQTPGSPQLNSFGPIMTLANELLQKGERNTVLDYLVLCAKFWKTGAPQLDSWSETVRNGQTPAFGGNLR